MPSYKDVPYDKYDDCVKFINDFPLRNGVRHVTMVDAGETKNERDNIVNSLIPENLTAKQRAVMMMATTLTDKQLAPIISSMSTLMIGGSVSFNVHQGKVKSW